MLGKIQILQAQANQLELELFIQGQLQNENGISIVHLQVELAVQQNYENYNIGQKQLMTCSNSSCEIRSFIQLDDRFNYVTQSLNLTLQVSNGQNQTLFCGSYNQKQDKTIRSIKLIQYFQDCGGSSATVECVQLIPYPVKIGVYETVQVQGFAKNSFYFNKLHYTVLLSGAPLLQETIQFYGGCFKSGKCVQSKSFIVPNKLPPGIYDFQLNFQNDSDQNLVCVLISAHIT